jgi:hypothetical protein
MAVMPTVVVASRSRLDPEKSGVNIKKGNKAAKKRIKRRSVHI